MGGLTSRLAGLGDIPALEAVMDAAIGELQRGFLTPAQIDASRLIMGLDRQLIADGTYFVVEAANLSSAAFRSAVSCSERSWACDQRCATWSALSCTRMISAAT